MDAVRTRRVRPAVVVAAGAACVDVVAIRLLLGLAPQGRVEQEGPTLAGESFAAALTSYVEFVEFYYAQFAQGGREGDVSYLLAFPEVLTPLGVGLATTGAIAWWMRGRSAEAAPLLGPFCGSVVFLALLAGALLLHERAGASERYLAPLLPPLVVLECAGLAWLATRRVVLAAAALAATWLWAMVPAAIDLSRAPYRADLERRASRAIAEAAAARPVRLLGQPVSPLFSKTASVHDFDPRFYRYYGGWLAFRFHTGERLEPIVGRYRFDRHGFPIPDELTRLAPAGATVVLSPIRFTVEDGPGSGGARERITPLVVLRWWPERAANRACAAGPTDVCVEVIVPPTFEVTRP